mmetsp:Transcript_39/g.130  ORF Transcript_39/g.130 Transcript_39/m.130 type:complete len:157 (-) Transcript_39:1913-2383(-)|eukprot:CAMPEP_0171496476 /NCGR_PEP_ID=MMETSP0958-20121227/6726_1 /TAXON_ID=87120 /ORGANISM="Aurantiochytrium limacinum, Strain ATCCMYA-1381" /LENGTH=156 /DNA_ID=CAMNT_0012030589 /DNA_START=99 /DNA_END=569 /DNA_ORIENTATION=+
MGLSSRSQLALGIVALLGVAGTLAFVLTAKPKSAKATSAGETGDEGSSGSGSTLKVEKKLDRELVKNLLEDLDNAVHDSEDTFCRLAPPASAPGKVQFIVRALKPVTLAQQALAEHGVQDVTTQFGNDEEIIKLNNSIAEGLKRIETLSKTVMLQK